MVVQRLYHTSPAQSTPSAVCMGHPHSPTAPDTLRMAGDAAQVIRPVGGREAWVSVARFTVPIVAVTAYISNTKNAISHTPPNLVVGRCRRTLIASGSEDLQVEHPVGGGQAPAFHFHPTLARVQGPALIRDQVVQVRQAGEKRRLTPTGMVEAGF